MLASVLDTNGSLLCHIIKKGSISIVFNMTNNPTFLKTWPKYKTYPIVVGHPGLDRESRD